MKYRNNRYIVYESPVIIILMVMMFLGLACILLPSDTLRGWELYVCLAFLVGISFYIYEVIRRPEKLIIDKFGVHIFHRSPYPQRNFSEHYRWSKIKKVYYDWEFTSRGRGNFAIDDLIFTMAFAHKDVKINLGEYWVCRRNLKKSVKHFAGAEDIFDEEKTRRNYRKHLRHIAISVAIVLVIIALIKKYS